MTNMCHSKAKLFVIVIASALMAIGNLCLSDAAAQVKPSAAGATSQPTFAPAVVGWRGDGTGQYPNCSPPTQWYLKENGESKNILWKVKLPCYSWATPIIVGDKLITRSEPYDLICMDKNTGKLLWIRSHPPFIAVSDEEKRANPAFKEIEPLVGELQKVNDAFVAQGWTKELYKQKYDLQHKINDLTAKADKKYALPPDMYVESTSGHTGTTPCSDGQFIYITSGAGITARYDLDGNRKWLRYESVPSWGEHGGPHCSPALVGDKLLAATTMLVALNKATGVEVWHQSISGSDAYSLPTFKAGGTDFVFCSGNYIRVSDGKIVVPRGSNWPGGTLAVINGNVFYFVGHLSFWRWEPKPDGGLSVTPLIDGEYHNATVPSGQNPAFKFKLDDTLATFYTASPLYHEGLLYCVANAGRLVVADTKVTKKDEVVVYSSFPPFDFKNGFGRKTFGMGMGASPALGGKHIYMIDSTNCTIVMEPGREYKQVAKNTIDYTVPEGWEPKHWMGPHHEQTEASPIFDGSRIYIRGEQFIYCVGEK